MFITCLDLEGVLAPEIWLEFAAARELPELNITTRDEPDYDKLMNFRLEVLNKNNLGLKEIQETISQMDLLPGAKDFLDELRSFSQVIIISDTFTQFANPLMDKLAWPTIMCNELIVGHDGMITGYRMRVHDSKLSTINALQQSMGYEAISAGDSYNDVGMIRASKGGGFLFRTTEGIKAENPDIPAIETYEELLTGIQKIMKL